MMLIRKCEICKIKNARFKHHTMPRSLLKKGREAWCDNIYICKECNLGHKLLHKCFKNKELAKIGKAKQINAIKMLLMEEKEFRQTVETEPTQIRNNLLIGRWKLCHPKKRTPDIEELLYVNNTEWNDG